MKQWLLVICVIIGTIILLIRGGFPIWLKRRNYKQQGVKVCPFCKKNISWWQQKSVITWNCTLVHHKCYLESKKKGWKGWKIPSPTVVIVKGL